MILVTGGAGYIGSHTVRELRSRGYDVVVYDNLSTGHIEAVGDAIFVKGDLFDVELLKDTFKKYGVDSVIHFAAYSLVGESMTNPLKYYHNNVAGTLALLEAMVRRKISCFFVKRGDIRRYGRGYYFRNFPAKADKRLRHDQTYDGTAYGGFRQGIRS